jgi:2-oxo-4-hydroxy-4-carboxy-5-ureidoimidazoline decarboxylase
MISLAELNNIDRAAFVTALGPLFEHSPWVAEETFDCRPFRDAAHLYVELCATLRRAAPERRIALIRAHPDLAGRLAALGQLTAASAREQASAGLNRLSEKELSEFQTLNASYRARFGWPFVICARLNSREDILRAMRSRLGNSPETEQRTALDEIEKIAQLRLADALAVEKSSAVAMSAKLSTHVLDLSVGRPAAGLRLALWRLDPQRCLVKSDVTNVDGRTDTPLLGPSEMTAGAFEIVFGVGEYFGRGAGVPFFDEVSVCFNLIDPAASYHIPLLVTPWSYSTYRGS